MAVNLSKGQKVDLTKTNPGLKELLVGLGSAVMISISTPPRSCLARTDASRRTRNLFSMAISNTLPAP